jgi:hypothetical protein
MINTKFGILAVSIAAVMAIGLSMGHASATSVDFQLDIKPGSDPNSINPNSKGVIPFAFLSDMYNDATTIDGNSLMFCPVSVDFAVACYGVPVHKYFNYDVDGDGDLDLLGYIKTQDAGIDCWTIGGQITGNTLPEYGGYPVYGMDTINPVPCNDEI